MRYFKWVAYVYPEQYILKYRHFQTKINLCRIARSNLNKTVENHIIKLESSFQSFISIWPELNASPRLYNVILPQSALYGIKFQQCLFHECIWKSMIYENTSKTAE